MPSSRILYVGHDLSLLKFLQDELKDCMVVRCHGSHISRLLIESKINYALFVFDEEMPEMSGQELTALVREMARREDTPIVIFKPSDDFKSLVKTITRSLGCVRNDGLAKESRQEFRHSMSSRT
jgi:DNA-binding response OmpR family regulator